VSKIDITDAKGAMKDIGMAKVSSARAMHAKARATEAFIPYEIKLRFTSHPWHSASSTVLSNRLALKASLR
jgi:hypothetical protein